MTKNGPKWTIFDHFQTQHVPKTLYLVHIQPKNTRKPLKTHKNSQNVSKIVYFWPIFGQNDPKGTLWIHPQKSQVPWPWGTLGLEGSTKNYPKSTLGVPYDMGWKKKRRKCGLNARNRSQKYRKNFQNTV
jgi:hypothetical protein